MQTSQTFASVSGSFLQQRITPEQCLTSLSSGGHCRAPSESSSFSSSTDLEQFVNEDSLIQNSSFSVHQDRFIRSSQQHKFNSKHEKPIDALQKVCGNNMGASVLGENYFSLNTLVDDTNSFLTTSLDISRIEGERICNASAVAILVRSLLLFTPKVQLDILKFIDKLARAGPFNQENLTSVGCIALLLETICSFLESSSPLLTHALLIVEVLGAFRLSPSELRILVRYILLLWRWT